jgi:hypothetical protein
VKRVLLLFAAACTSPAPSSLKPGVSASEEAGELHVDVDFGGDTDVDVTATFRHRTYRLKQYAHGFYNLFIDLDQVPVASDEPLAFDIDGISMTMTAPTSFDMLDVPLFVSRSHDATMTWSPATPDPMYWYLQAAICAMSSGGAIPANATSVTFTAADWSPPPFNSQPTCTAYLVLTRTRTTPIDPAFAGGAASFDRVVDLQFASTP